MRLDRSPSPGEDLAQRIGRSPRSQGQKDKKIKSQKTKRQKKEKKEQEVPHHHHVIQASRAASAQVGSE